MIDTDTETTGESAAKVLAEIVERLEIAAADRPEAADDMGKSPR